MFIENDASFSSEDSLLSSGISDDDALVENEDSQKEVLQMFETSEDSGAKPGSEKEQAKTDQARESRSSRQERNTRYSNFL